MIIFSQTEETLSLTQIEEVEQFIGLTFPDEYKNHLLKNNGGQSEPNVFSFEEDGKESESNVDWFLAIYDGEYDNLKEYATIYKKNEKRVPENILPIAHDPGGNLICISCTGDDIGSVYFWDHEKENSDHSNMYLIAKSFNQFINELKEDFN